MIAIKKKKDKNYFVWQYKHSVPVNESLIIQD